MATARPRAACPQVINSLLSKRSTNEPAMGPKTIQGAVVAASTAETANGRG